MTTEVAIMNETNVSEVAVEDKVSPSKSAPEDAVANPASPSAGGSGKEAETPTSSKIDSSSSADKKVDHGLSPTPPANAMAGYPTAGTPQGAYYQASAYHQQSQLHVTPEPPSPQTGTTAVYDMGSFFQQQGAFAPQSPFVPNTLSPARGNNGMGMIPPPASPLFPRPTTNVGGALQPEGLEGARGIPPQQQQTPSSPNLPYMSPPTMVGGASSSSYSQYPPVSHVNSTGSSTEDVNSAWGESHVQQGMPYQTSPQLNAYGVPMSRATSGGRAYSFDNEMLPPSAVLDQHDQQGNPAYSPYGGSQNSGSGGGGTLFANQQQPWGYGGPQDMYNSPGSPSLQPRPTAMGGAMPYQRGPYGQYYPASSPGPPIQTTASNKGPDGANLFIFHIPNHFTNLDMYQLFCPYGNLLSVRIMVEKDTGRSRGFGFVSYDAPESAALAIKELNGFAIGNKRLKVQHKQIRQKDQLHNDNREAPQAYDGSYQQQQRHQQFPPSLPPAGAASQPNDNSGNWWGDNPSSPGAGGRKPAAAEGTEKGDEVTDRTSTSTGGETPLGLSAESGAPNVETMSPLTNMGTMQHSLPEVKGTE